MIKNITDFTSKNAYGKCIEGVHVTPNAVVATDSFKLIEIKQETGAADSFTVKLPKGLKTFDKIERVGTGANIYHKGAKYEVSKIEEDEFPKYEQIFPTDKPVAVVRLNAEFLRQIATAFESIDPTFGAINVTLYGENKPVVFTEDQNRVRAILMPIMK